MQIQKSPNRAETGFSENIHSAAMNDAYLSMILKNPKCLAFCCDVLERYECLLQRFTPSDPFVYRGNEVDAFIALSNIEKSLNNEAVS